jgi:hypothetical protein
MWATNPMPHASRSGRDRTTRGAGKPMLAVNPSAQRCLGRRGAGFHHDRGFLLHTVQPLTT